MRILLAGDTYPPDVNGAAVFARRLGEGLARRGHEVHCIAPSPAGFSYKERSANVWVHRTPSFKYPWHAHFYIADLRRVNRYVDTVVADVAPDIVHIQSHFLVGRAAARSAMQRHIPLVATNHFMPENLRHQLPFGMGGSLYRLLAKCSYLDLRHVLRAAATVTAPTTHAANLLSAQAHVHNVIPISCGIDLKEFRPNNVKRKAAGDTVLFVGRLEVEKHVDEILNALTLLDSKIQLNIVGIGSQEIVLRKLATSLGIDDRVHFRGWLNDEDLRAEYRNADAFCMPGTAELQSIATLEAMAAGLPIVAANSHALPLLVKPGVNGELFTSGNVVELAGAISRVLATTANWRELSEGSRLMAGSHDLSSTLDSFEAVYMACKPT